MKKQETLQSEGQQEKVYDQDVQGTDTQLSKGAESERESAVRKGLALERELYVHS